MESLADIISLLEKLKSQTSTDACWMALDENNCLHIGLRRKHTSASWTCDEKDADKKMQDLMDEIVVLSKHVRFVKVDSVYPIASLKPASDTTVDGTS